VPPNDVLSVEAQASRQRMLSIQAANQRDIAEAELARLVGLPFDARIEPATALAVSDRGATEGVADLVTIAQQQRNDRAALVQRSQAARERARAAAAGLKPTVAVGGGFDYARPNPRIFPRNESWQESWDASINVSWPLFDGGRAGAETSEALEASRALEERLADFDAVLTVEVRQRISEIDSARAAVGAAGDAVRAAVEARRVVGDRFSAGVATSTEVLDAQVAVLQAELDRAQTIAAVNLAEARLRRALGK
jgi:outer membrane protein TolC